MTNLSEVLTCTSKFLCIFETLPHRKTLYTYLNSAEKLLLNYLFKFVGHKKLHFVVQCNGNMETAKKNQLKC
jgi:hypothetical protein